MSLPVYRRQSEDGCSLGTGFWEHRFCSHLHGVANAKRINWFKQAARGRRQSGIVSCQMMLNSSQIPKICNWTWMLGLEVGRSRLQSPGCQSPADFIAINSCCSAASRPPVTSSVWWMKQSPLFPLASLHLLLFKHPSLTWGIVIPS